MAKWFKIFMVFLFLPSLLYPQYQNIKFGHLTVDDGLSNNFIRDIVQDSSGFMWFATEDGLNKYDGYRFTVYRHDPNDSTSLSENQVEVLQVSKNGILWIGTNGGGLNAFNPQTEAFTRYNMDFDDLNGISKESIFNMYEDKTNRLWIRVGGKGLYRFDPKTEEIIRYAHNPDDPNSISTNLVSEISSTIDNDKEIIWVGTWGGGLNKFDPEKNLWTHYRHDPDDRNSLRDNYIGGLYFDHSGILWISTDNGLDKLDPKTGRFTNYSNNPHNPNSLSGNIVGDVWEKDGILWIATMNGFNRFDIKKEEFKSYFHNPADPASIGQSTVWRIHESKSGILWIGGWSGLDFIDFEQKSFVTYRQQPGNPNSLSDNSVASILETQWQKNDILWVGTKDGGLNKINRRTGEFTHYSHKSTDPNSLSDNFVFSITESSYDDKKELWLATMVGLNRFDPQTGKFTHYRYNPNDTTSISEDIVHKVYSDRDGYIWIGTRNGGLCRYDPGTQKFRRYHHHLGEIWVIRQDTSGSLWHGSVTQGLIKLDPVTDMITYYKYDPEDENSISSNTIRSIHESFFNGEHFLWIGTNAGLNRFDYETERFYRYTKKDGLPSDEISGILEDKQGNLWLGTGYGLSKFDPVSGTIRNYDKDDGLPGNQFIRGAYFQSDNGEMFFGGTNGFTSFFPEQIKDNPHIPEIVLTDFQIFYKSVPVKNDSPAEGDNYYLPGHISALSQIELPYDQSVFSFEFAALDFRKPQKNRYAYKMEGVDPDWVHTDASRRFATYTNLDPGEYVFNVIGSNNDGVWNEEGTSIKITILPPWWRTSWAYTLYALLILSMVYGVWRFQTNRLKMRQQMEMEHFEAENLREVDQMKSRFFANISHEFRTPLTLIRGPITQILSDEFKGNLKEQCRTILRYNDRLLNLINQILDLSKLESGRMILKVSCTDVTRSLKGIVQSFASLAERKHITLGFKTEPESISGYVDKDKLEKITTNLLSNAFKFTPEGGRVEVAFNIPPHPPSKGGTPESPFGKGGHRGILISIFNSGAGIPSDQLDKIFDRFYQVDESYTKDSEGTGIGLALAKELVEAHRGEIHVESELNKGTTFTVWLPIEREHFKPEEIVDEPLKDEEILDIPLHPTSKREAKGDVLLDIQAKELATKSRPPKSAPLLLIVEDNPDVTSYISSFMENDCRIAAAENGEAGLKKALDRFPDLIISDVMMPAMDGFELCKRLKSDERSSHIPVILLTAKADMDSKIEGLEFGADDYVTKPFDAKELHARAKNLIEQRKKLREKFSRMIEVKPNEIAASSMDEQFLSRLLNVFEDHIDESDFSTEDFARAVGMSRTNLHLKLKALTNQPTHEFLRTLRLKRAAQLLKQSAGTVTEIAYAVGFNNPSYFSRIFRQQFGQTPSEFANKNQNIETPK